MKALRWGLPLAIFAVLVGFLFVGLYRDPREVPSPLIGKPAPAFSLADLREPGRKVATSDFKGQVWLLNVWASWCVSCRVEHPLSVRGRRHRCEDRERPRRGRRDLTLEHRDHRLRRTAPAW